MGHLAQRFLLFDDTLLAFASCLADPTGEFDTALCKDSNGVVRFTNLSLYGLNGDRLLGEIMFHVIAAPGDVTDLTPVIDTITDQSGVELGASTASGRLTIKGGESGLQRQPVIR